MSASNISSNPNANLVGGINAKFMSKEEMAKFRALDEARKAGTAPPLVDEEGEDINPHIPQYMLQVPFFLNDGAPTLKHQKYDNFKRVQTDGLDKYYKKGAEAKPEGKKTEKFRSGACKNCGAMTHATKDCTERKRRRGAAATGVNYAADENQLEDINFSFEGKRDRWNGYDSSVWKNEVLASHQEMEADRKKVRDQKMQEKIFKKQQKEKGKEKSKKRKREENEKEGKDKDSKEKDDNSCSSSSDSENDLKDEDLKGDEDENEDKLLDSKTKVTSYYAANNRSTVRNLRIREDTAKYLLNLDENSAFYDPKSRSMRENPNPDKGVDGDFESGGIQTSSSGPIATSIFKGDAQLSASGSYVDVMKMTKFAMEAEKVNATAGEGKKGVVSAVATPSQTELMYRQFLDRKEDMKKEKQKKVVQKYGGEEFLLDPESM